MKLEKTERDKKLLVFLGIFITVVGFCYLGIGPLMSDIAKLHEAIAAAGDIKAMNERKLAELPDLVVENKDLSDGIEKMRGRWYPMMTNDEIDSMFTNLALSFRLYSYALSIDTPDAECVLEPYRYSKKAQDEDKKSGTFEGSGIYCATVTMQLGGEKADLEALVDALSNNSEKLRIRKYSYDTQAEAPGASLNITVDLYMCSGQSAD